MRKLKWLIPIIGAAGVFAPTTCRAWITPEFYISCQPYSTYFGGALPGVPNSDFVHFHNDAFNGWTLDITGQVLGTARNPTLDLLIQATSPSVLSPFNSGPVDVSIYEPGIGPMSGSFNAVVSGTATGNAQPIHFFASYNTANPSYYQPGTSFMYSAAIGPFDYSSSITSDPMTLNSFSLTEGIRIEHPLFGPGSTEAPGASYTIHATLSLVPEPSVATLAVCAVGAFYCSRRIRARRPN